MKNIDSWTPTKYVLDDKGVWTPNREIVGKHSFYTATLQIKTYQKVLEDHTRGDLLDCGAGTVPYYGIYRELVSSTTCSDWGDSYHELPYIDDLVDLTKKWPYKNSSFDTVLLADVLEHIHNPNNIFNELQRVLRKEGKGIIFLPFMYWLHEDPYDFHRYTEFALRRFADEAGLAVISLEPYGGGADVLIDISHKFYSKNPVLYSLNNFFWRFFSLIGFYKKFTSHWHRKKFPLGYSLVVSKK